MNRHDKRDEAMKQSDGHGYGGNYALILRYIFKWPVATSNETVCT